MIGSGFGECGIDRANGVTRDAPRKADAAVMNRVIEITRCTIDALRAVAVPLADPCGWIERIMRAAGGPGNA